MSAPAMTKPDQAPPPPRARTVELVLAHMHLRLGALELSRVELETLAGLGGLDAQGLVDLAEVRWRTGDLLGAGEAATLALRANGSDPTALIVAAEAASAIGRPSEARRLATRALAVAHGAIDLFFAGMPRSGVWPTDANEPAPTAPTLFDRGPDVAAPVGPAAPAAHEPVAGPPVAKAAAGPMTLGLWDGDEVEDDVATAAPDPAQEFEAGRVALVGGSVDEAALRFGLALRLAPALAPAVLEATEGARASSLSVVRGDAYRLAGHEKEALQSYAVAARGGLPERRAAVRVRPKPKPVAASADDADVADATEADEAGESDAPEVVEAEADDAVDTSDAPDASEASGDDHGTAASSDGATDPNG